MSESLRISPHYGVDMKHDCRLSIAVSWIYPYYYYLPSYLTILELHYRGCIERSWVAQEKAGEVGISV